MAKKILSSVLHHKTSASFAIIILIGGGYYGYGKIFPGTATVSYSTAQVQKGALIVSVPGSGQISASNQIDIKPKVSGDIVWLGIKAGQEVRAGQALLSFDNANARKEIADQELAIAEARLSLDKAIAQAPITYENKLESLEAAKENLVKEYEDIFSRVSSAFLSLPTIITYTQNVLYGTELSAGKINQFNVDAYKDLFTQTADRELVNSFAEIAKKDYKTARDAYDNNFSQFKILTLYSGESEKEEMLKTTINTTRAIAQATKSEINLLDTIVDIAKQRNQSVSSTITTFQSNLRTHLSTANNNLSALLSQETSLKSAKTSITNLENEIYLLQINNPTGDNPIDLQISKNALEKKKSTLADLREKLADYTVHAPFGGVIAKVSVKKEGSVSSATNLATIISHQKIAEISLNEVDVATVKVGQRVTLTFDAIDNLSITGEVAEVDALGTVTQGIVYYSVKIVFDTQDEKVKPGMSVSATIITDVKQDILLVPNAAVKSSGERYYVEVMENNIPRNQIVEMGLSNDTMTEIKGGLKEGDKVVTQTTTVNAQTTTSNTPSNRSFMMMGAPR